MSLLFRRAEVRSSSFQALWGSGQATSVRGDSFQTALSLVPVYAATGLIADSIAASPWSSYVKAAGVPSRSLVQPGLLVDPGVNELDLFSWKHQLCSSLGLWGNAYGYVVDSDSRGLASKVAWLRPDKMVVDESGVRPEYFFDGRRIDRADLIHVAGFTVPGSVVGLSPIGLFRTQIETGIEAQKTGKNFFRRGAVPAGVLKNTAKTLSAEEAQTTKRRFVSSVSSNEPFVTGSDWDYTAMPLPTSDVNFIAGVKMTANQIAAVYRVDPEDVGGETSSSTLKYATLEMNEQRFNGRTLLPVATRIEAVLNRHLSESEYVKFNLDARIRTDLKTRYDAHSVAIAAGFKTADEVRELEEMRPLTTVEREQILLMKGKTPAGV